MIALHISKAFLREKSKASLFFIFSVVLVEDLLTCQHDKDSLENKAEITHVQSKNKILINWRRKYTIERDKKTSPQRSVEWI